MQAHARACREDGSGRSFYDHVILVIPQPLLNVYEDKARATQVAWKALLVAK